MTTPTIAAAIAARAQARTGYLGCPDGWENCTHDHRTDAERARDALAACADLAAWFGGMHEHWHCGYHDRRGANCSPEAIDDGFCMTNLDVAQHCTEGRIERERVAWLYDAIQRHAGGEHA